MRGEGSGREGEDLEGEGREDEGREGEGREGEGRGALGRCCCGPPLTLTANPDSLLLAPEVERGGREDGTAALAVGPEEERAALGLEATERFPAEVEDPLLPPVTVRPRAESRSIPVGGRCSSDLRFSSDLLLGLFSLEDR